MLHCIVVSHWLTAYTKWSLSTVNWYNGFPDSKVHVAHMGPTWVLSAPDGPHVGPINLAIRLVCFSGVFPYVLVYSIDYHWFLSCTAVLLWHGLLPVKFSQYKMTSSNGNIFCLTGPLWGESTQSLVNSPHKGQRRGAWIFSFICTWTNRWGSNRDAGDLRCCHAHYDITAMRHPIVHPWGIGYILWV